MKVAVVSVGHEVRLGDRIDSVPVTWVEVGDIEMTAPTIWEPAFLECGHLSTGSVCCACGRASGKARYVPGINIAYEVLA